ncbi:MAG TPA: VanZ family protein [Burkholderiaceae bacterium]|nr:VanZ family protein [Burkholderiaceae bacterium]
MPPRHRSSASPLALLYAALIVYASLYPFSGWRLPGVALLSFLGAPWPRYWTWFDLVANFVGYMPLGALIFGALVRSGARSGPAFAVALAGGTCLSFGVEFVQNFLPQRVASNLDLALNAAGALVGALLAWLIHRGGGIERWQAARDRWFIGRSAGGLALLLLWPVGLLFPLPVPLGMGQVLGRLLRGVAELVDNTPVEAWFDQWFESWGDAAAQRVALAPAAEFSLVALGLLAPCLVAFTVSRPGWRRAVLVLGAAALGCATTTLSTALNFGPEHALAWNTPRVLVALAAAVVIAMLCSPVPRRAAAGLGLVALSALITLVAQAPSDPYFAVSLQGWEQGRFIRFHGAARWVGWLWPYAAILYLLARLGARDPEPRGIGVVANVPFSGAADGSPRDPRADEGPPTIPS